jgi:predicted transcriptional regulator
VWATLQAHPNVVAVASLLDLAAVIVTEGASVPPEVIAKADAERIPVLSSPRTTYWVVSQLAKLGIQAQD